MRPGTKTPSGRPFEKGHRKQGGRKKGTSNKVTREVKDLLASILEDPEYQASLRERMIGGRAPQLEALAFYYALGRPRHQVKLETQDSLAWIFSAAHALRNKEERAKRAEEQPTS